MKQYIKYYFSKNLNEYIKLFGLFTIGIIVSVITVNKANDFQKKEVQTYINSQIENVKNIQQYDCNEIFVNSLKSNVKDLLVLALLASTIVGMPVAYFLVCKKGFSVGYTIASIYATQNTKTAIIFICNSMVFHNIMYMISMFVILVAGSSFIRSILGKDNNVKFEITKYVVFLMIALCIVILSSVWEAYISTNFMYFLKKYL